MLDHTQVASPKEGKPGRLHSYPIAGVRIQSEGSAFLNGHYPPTQHMHACSHMGGREQLSPFQECPLSAGGDKDGWGRRDGHWSPCLLQSRKCSFLAMLIERVCSYTSQVCAFLNLAYFIPVYTVVPLQDLSMAFKRQCCLLFKSENIQQ